MVRNTAWSSSTLWRISRCASRMPRPAYAAKLVSSISRAVSRPVRGGGSIGRRRGLAGRAVLLRSLAGAWVLVFALVLVFMAGSSLVGELLVPFVLEKLELAVELLGLGLVA